MNKYYKCRLCLEECSRKIEIFKDDFPELIDQLTGIKVEPNDGLPENSCYQCYREVKSAMLTRYQIINSHKILLEELKSSHCELKNQTVTDTLYHVKTEIPSTSNIHFVNVDKITSENDTLHNTLRKNSFMEDMENDSLFFPNFSEASNEITSESDTKLESLCVKTDMVSERISCDESDESCVANENSDDSLSSTGTDKLFANAENIIKAAKSNPSQHEERTFKKLIRRLQSKKSRASTSTKKIKPNTQTKEHDQKEEVKTLKFKKKTDSIYRVKVNYELKPEHLEYLKSVRRKDRVSCPICSRQMFGSNLKTHLITHTYDPTPCHLCGKTSKNAQALQDHINYYHKNNPHRFICEQCGKGFRVPGSLDKHRKKEHEGPREKTFECNVCGKKFYEKMQLKNHINITHNKIKPFKCEHCGKDFGRRTQFVTHQLVHTKENRYHCQVCGKGFKIKQTMQTHLKGVHGIEEEKTIFCKICQKGFSSAQGLRAHVNSRVHGLEKCEHCSEFITLEYKDVHLRDIHGIKTENIYNS